MWCICLDWHHNVSIWIHTGDVVSPVCWLSLQSLLTVATEWF